MKQAEESEAEKDLKTRKHYYPTQIPRQRAQLAWCMSIT
jgi:hypothetical protein